MSITTTNSLSAYLNSCLPETSVNKVCTNPADSTNIFSNNTTASSTDIEINSENASDTTKAIKREIDINKLAKEYKKNPAGVLAELEAMGIKFSNEQKAVLETYLTSGKNNTQNKNNIKSLLEIVKQSNLTADDIFAGISKVAEKDRSGFFNRAGDVLKTLFKGEFKEAWEKTEDLFRDEIVSYSEDLGDTMSEIREEREDFSSNGLADIADAILSAIGIKDDAMHFIEKEQTTGEHLYTENDVVNVTDILTQNPDKAEDFTANAIELEAIKDKANNIKYDGSTIVNVGEKMTIYEELKSTMIHTAQKGDMTDNFLIGITDNLVENPEMQDALDIFLNLKDNDGKDRFSAKNIFDQSGFMVDKDKATIVSYTGETLYLSKHGNLSGDNIVSISGNITDNPGIRESVHEQLSTGNYTGDELESYTNELAYNTQENNYNSDCSSKDSASDNVNYCTDSSDTNEKLVAKYTSVAEDTKNFFSNNNETDVETTVQETEEEKIEINGNKYNRKAVQQEFYKKYGTVGDALLAKLEANPKFIETIKQYSGYPLILESIANNPSTVNKLLCATSGLSKNDLAEILPLCTNTQNTNLLISLTEKFGPALAVRYFKTAKDSNNLDQIEFIMSNNTIDGETKKSKIENSCLA